MGELHVISNGKKSWSEFAQIAAAIHPYVTGIHIREKQKTAKEIWEGIEKLKTAGVPNGKIYINDRVDVAWAAKVQGVQLAYHSLEPLWVKSAFPGLRVGRSVHSAQEACEMETQGADFLLYGHVFPTGSKPGLEARGLQSLTEAAAQVDIPVIAIGGIHPGNAWAVMKAGAAGIAVMSGIWEAENPLDRVKEYQQALQEGREKYE